MCVIRNCKTSSDKQTYPSTKWLEKRFSDKTGYTISLYNRKFKPVHDFMLIWNIFERDVLRGKGDKIIYHEKDVFEFGKNKYPANEIICFFYFFLKERYTNSKNGAIRFEHLGLSSKKIDISVILFDNKSTISEMNQVCLTIAFRYRNNLFHGNKETADIIKDVELFEKTNAYLIAYIDGPLTMKSE